MKFNPAYLCRLAVFASSLAETRGTEYSFEQSRYVKGGEARREVIRKNPDQYMTNYPSQEPNRDFARMVKDVHSTLKALPVSAKDPQVVAAIRDFAQTTSLIAAVVAGFVAIGQPVSAENVEAIVAAIQQQANGNGAIPLPRAA